MNKKGFTLVELLAVIAILALLIIIALPNVLEMFNRVKKEIFLTEAKNLYKEVSKKYITENMRGNVINKIDSSDNKLNIDTDKLVYDIRLDDSGVIKDFKVSDGTYCIRSRINDIKSLTYELIEEGDCEGNPYAPEPVKCTYDGKLVQGAEFVQGAYTYRYRQEGKNLEDGTTIDWQNIRNDGWGVQLTDKSSTSSVSGEICAFINDKPVVSTNAMYRYSKASSIDISNFNSSKVTNMNSMFYESAATEIIGLEKLDTHNVTTMGNMFNGSKAKTLDVANFNTKKVKYMDFMFKSTEATKLDLSNFDTDNVIRLYAMFWASKAEVIDGLEFFNTSKVTNMDQMFRNCHVKSLDISTFDISDKVNLENMFWDSNSNIVYVKNSDIVNLFENSDVINIPKYLKVVVK